MEHSRNNFQRGDEWFKPILLGGLVAGAVDIVTAVISTLAGGGQPIRMLQGIAYALIGRGAFNGGWSTGTIGLICHFTIALGAAAAYVAVSKKWSVMVREPVVCGLLYGVPVYLVTNYVIVPLSRIGRVLPPSPTGVAIGLLVMTIGFGLPIALATRRYACRTSISISERG